MLYPGGIGGPSSKSSTTYYGAANPDTNPKYSSISNLIKERSKDAKRIKKRKALNKLQKNLTQIPAESIENVFDVLSSFNVDIEAEISRIKPSVTDTDTDINNKKC
jgi:gas vesicle protein